MKEVSFTGHETEVQIPEKMLMEINETAEATRKTRINEMRNI